MVGLKELLNDFHPLEPENERNGLGHKEFDLKIGNHDFVVQYMVQPMPLDYCLMYADGTTKRRIRSEFGPQRTVLNFQFYYRKPDYESSSLTQDLQDFPDGTVFPLIKQIGNWLFGMQNKVDTIVFGGDLERKKPYLLFSRKIESNGWTLVEGEGPGPNGRGHFFALFKNGT